MGKDKEISKGSKRQRTKSSNKVSPLNKRQKDILEGSVDDFLEYLDDKRPDPVKNIAVATTSKDNRILLPAMDAAQLKAVLIETFREPDCRNVLSEIFRPLVSESEGRLLSRIDSLQKELANRDIIISKLESQVKTLECKMDDIEQSTRNKFLRFQGIQELAGENTDYLRPPGDH